MKDKIISISFVSFLIIFMVLNIFNNDKIISTYERRKLQQFPDISIKNILNKNFMEDFDSYTLDQFVYRDFFRNIKANFNYKILLKLDNNGIYIKDNYVYKTEYPTNKKSIDNFVLKINNIISELNENNEVYYSIIPDKNYYLNEKLFLNIDYNYLYNTVISNIHSSNFIDLRESLTINDYFKTDTHWKQNRLSKVISKLEEKMSLNINNNYTSKTINDFYGVYYGQSALNLESENLEYLTNNIIENCFVYYYDDKSNNKVYTLNKTDSLDKYDIFLDGASSYIEIYNPNNNSDKELIIFRDSFGSSLTPLLINSYSKIILIDLRYISSSIYSQLVDFNNQDVLFIFSTLIVNNSGTLKD